MMKILFLDHDGVICLPKNFGSRFKKARKFTEKKKYRTYGNMSMESDLQNSINLPIDCRLDDFDKKSIKVINEILEETDCEVVVSSDWKRYATLKELQSYYKNQGIIKSPIDVTPDISDFDENTYELFSYKNWIDRIRVLEIKEWMSRNQFNFDKWVAVDDLNIGLDIKGLKNFIYITNQNEGIKKTGIKEKIIQYLK